MFGEKTFLGFWKPMNFRISQSSFSRRILQSAFGQFRHKIYVASVPHEPGDTIMDGAYNQYKIDVQFLAVVQIITS
jgi:hypothetical protein